MIDLTKSCLKLFLFWLLLFSHFSIQFTYTHIYFIKTCLPWFLSYAKLLWCDWETDAHWLKSTWFMFQRILIMLINLRLCSRSQDISLSLLRPYPIACMLMGAEIVSEPACYPGTLVRLHGTYSGFQVELFSLQRQQPAFFHCKTRRNLTSPDWSADLICTLHNVANVVSWNGGNIFLLGGDNSGALHNQDLHIKIFNNSNGRPQPLISCTIRPAWSICAKRLPRTFRSSHICYQKPPLLHTVASLERQ